MGKSSIPGIIALLLVASGCVRGVPVTFDVSKAAPIELAKDEEIAVMTFVQLEKDDEFDSSKELTRLVKQVLEEKKRYSKVTVLPNTPITDNEEFKDLAKWLDTPTKLGWQALRQTADSRLVILGTVIFHGDSYTGYVNETVEDEYTGRPVRRTVRKQLADYNFDVRLVLMDTSENKVVLNKVYKGHKTFEGTTSIYGFFTIIEPDVREFVTAITGEKHVERRRLIK